MAQIIVRGLDDEVVGRLKRRARGSGHSLESEVRAILEQAARMDAETARSLAAEIRATFRGRTMADSADLVRDARDR